MMESFSRTTEAGGARNRRLILFVAMCAAFLTACAQQEVAITATAENEKEVGVAANFGCTYQPTLSPDLTGDIPSTAILLQEDVDCYAWQTFIALNWPVDPGWPANPDLAGEPDKNAKADDWGDPPTDPSTGPYQITVWETYKQSEGIFNPEKFDEKGEPYPWGQFADLPSACTANARVAESEGTIRVVSATTKFGFTAAPSAAVLEVAGDTLIPDKGSTDEAFGGWLTDQNKQLTRYEKLVNRAEFEYIVAPTNQLYKASQQKLVAEKDGLTLPMGQSESTSWQDIGAIELKAAWRVVAELPQEQQKRFLITKAYVYDRQQGTCTPELLGLVGLHIIHKTATFPNFMWTTFEHVDNVHGDDFPEGHPFGFSYNNPECTTCETNKARIDENGKPLFPKDDPVQVKRDTPIPTNQGVVALNLAVQEMIGTTNPRSVFQYYQLVNVLWPQSPNPPYTGPGKTKPLNVSSMTSAGPNSPVANTTLETYIQSFNCTQCHASATISGDDSLASDFSFLFQEAPTPPPK